MLLKSKICLTVLTIYEMFTVTALHFQPVCAAIFDKPFCSTWYRYFLFCIIVPGLFLLALMWLREIILAYRRRRFFRRAKNTVNSVMSSIRGRVSENVDIQNMEKIITAAVLLGIKKYADRHPNLRKNVNNIMDIANGDMELDIMATDDEVQPAPTRTRRAASSKKQSTRKRK